MYSPAKKIILKPGMFISLLNIKENLGNIVTGMLCHYFLILAFSVLCILGVICTLTG